MIEVKWTYPRSLVCSVQLKSIHWLFVLTQQSAKITLLNSAAPVRFLSAPGDPLFLSIEGLFILFLVI